MTSLHIKKSMKKTHFSSNLFKNEDFFKISKTNDYLNYLKKLLEQHFSKTLRCFRKCKKHFFCDVTKVENFDKKMSYFIQKKQKKVHLNIFASVDQNPQ
jgi:hypothetical protein